MQASGREFPLKAACGTGTLGVAGAIVLAMVAGCESSRQSVSDLPGGELIGEHRINKKVLFGRPVLRKVDWDARPEVICLRIERRREMTFDLERRYQKVAAVRYVPETIVKKINDAVLENAVVLPVGHIVHLGTGLLPQLQKEMERNQNNLVEHKAAVQTLQGGATVAYADMYYIVPGREAVGALVKYKAVYRREVLGERVEVLRGQREERMVGAARVPVKLQPAAGQGGALAATTDEAGLALLTLATNLTEARALKPAVFRIQAFWDGSWTELGAVTVDRERTDAIVRAMEARRRPPVITVLSPESGSKVGVARVRVQGTIRDDRGVARAAFRLNDRDVLPPGVLAAATMPGQRTPRRRVLPFAFDVDLIEGNNLIQVVAWDDEGLEARQAVSVCYEKSQRRVHVVSIGISAYKHVRGVKYAGADAKAVAEYFRRQTRMPHKHIELLVDHAATLTGIKKTLGVRLFEQVRRDDTVIIYFSGHGAMEAVPKAADRSGTAAYLLPVDADPKALFATALLMKNIDDILRRLVSERVVVLVDTCYAGSAEGRGVRPAGRGLRAINQAKIMEDLQKTGPGRAIMMACSPWEVAQEWDTLGHGVFTHCVLQGLGGKADRDHDKRITVRELRDYVQEEVRKITHDKQNPMVRVGDKVGELVIGTVK